MNLLNGKPTVELSGDEFLPKEGFVNQKINRLYVREVTLTKKLQSDVAVSIAVLGDSNLLTHPQGEIAKVLQNNVSANKNGKQK